MKPEKLVLALLDESYEKSTWHGPNLKQSLRGVTAKQAAWRPGRGRHNIWELALHAAYWKYIVRRRLTGERRGSFALAGSDFFKRPLEPGGLTETAWKKDLEILAREHRQLRATVSAIKRPSAPQQHLIRGAAAHDLYH